ncbi:MAG TPA: hypothetical protein ENN49_11300 [Bacteroidales bacterium]|nr:hypothetical protein [Bacteroidales bacterium]
MNIKYKLVLLSIVFLSCSKSQPKNVIVDITGNEQDLILIADSIKYEVVVHASENDIWDSERLQGYQNHKAFIDGTFKGILNGKLRALDYTTNEPLTVEEVRKIIEYNNIDASQIGKLLFTEQWLIDKQGHLHKKILSITFGKSEYSKQGTFKGYSALFTVKY